MNTKRDSASEQGELTIIWRVVIVLCLLVVFWYTFSIAALQNTTIKRLEDTDFSGHSLFSLIATVEKVDAALATIKAKKQELSQVEIENSKNIIDDPEISTAHLRLNEVYREIFTEFLINSGRTDLAASNTYNKALVGEAVSLKSVNDVPAAPRAEGGGGAVDEAAAAAAAPATAGSPAAATPAASTTQSAGSASVCPGAAKLYNQYAEYNQNIPAAEISDVVQLCLSGRDRQTISDALVEKLVKAQSEAQKVTESNAVAWKKGIELQSKMDLLQSDIKQLEDEIDGVSEESTASPEAQEVAQGEDAAETAAEPARPAGLSPLQLRNLFPEISDFLNFTVLGRGLKLQPELVLGLLTSIAGAVGGTSRYALGRFNTPGLAETRRRVVGGRQAAFVPTAFSGSFAGLSVFLILFGGLAVFQAGGTGSASSANYSSFAAFGFLSGMFSERVNMWLESIAGNIFSNAGKTGQVQAAPPAAAAQADPDPVDPNAAEAEAEAEAQAEDLPANTPADEALEADTGAADPAPERPGGQG